MQLTLLGLCLVVLRRSIAAPLNNNNPTIWAEDTVTVMKEQINALYQLNLGLYNNIHIFDGDSHDCVSPPPSSQYWNGTTCPNGNKLASEAIDAVAVTWRALATAMFPVYYNQTDTESQPRASFSDFSHFYNHLMLEIVSLQNTTEYYICHGNLTSDSAFDESIKQSFLLNLDFVNTRFGPPVSWIEPGHVPIGANNGTDGAYPYGSHFPISILRCSDLMQYGWEDLDEQMDSPDVPYSRSVCKRLKDPSGLLPPRPPASFG